MESTAAFRTVRVSNRDPFGVHPGIPHRQGPCCGKIYIFGQLDLQGAVRSIDSDVIVRQGACGSPQDIQFLAEISGEGGGTMVVPAEFQGRCILLTVDGEAFQFTGPVAAVLTTTLEPVVNTWDTVAPLVVLDRVTVVS